METSDIIKARVENYLNSLPAQAKERSDAARDLKTQGDMPYKISKKPNATALVLKKAYNDMVAESLPKDEFSISGRIMSMRDFGGGAFIVCADGTEDFQIFVSKKELNEADLKTYAILQVGDIVYGRGHLFRTKTNVLSLKVSELSLMTKSIRPLPEKYHGLSDHEIRYRKRYLDLIMNKDVRRVFEIRSKTTSFIRQFFLNREYMEVETPMLHSIQGGTTARPFKTHHNALDIPLYLRIAPELHLKRLVVGGMNRVFELNRNFRNEGISLKHNPEFTLLEFYEANATFQDLQKMVEELLSSLVNTIHGQYDLNYSGQAISFNPPFKSMSMENAILEFSNFKDKSKLRDAEYLSQYCADHHIQRQKGWSAGDFINAIFEHEVEAKLIQPTFITHQPVAVSPLARRNDQDPFVVDRFELFIFGREVSNAFNELNDPVDQLSRFFEQDERKKQGDLEACEVDYDYIEALEIGLPPTAGCGIGIDRLVMFLADVPSIRDVILFPLLKPEAQPEY